VAVRIQARRPAHKAAMGICNIEPIERAATALCGEGELLADREATLKEIVPGLTQKFRAWRQRV